jgi:hypothetical protein
MGMVSLLKVPLRKRSGTNSFTKIRVVPKLYEYQRNERNSLKENQEK